MGHVSSSGPVGSAATRRLVLALVVLATAASALALRVGRFTLNPRTYVSPSGEYKLYVDPSTIYGQGEGDYRLTRGESEVWAGKLPFSLWEAAVTDDGTVAGYAYSLGQENYPFDRRKDEEGKLHMVILDPRGTVRMNEVLPRRGIFTCTSFVDRNVAGIVVDSANDRFIVRCTEGGWSAPGEIWRTFRVSTGTLLDEFQFAHPRTSEREYWRLMAAKPIKDTPLVLVRWTYRRWGDDDAAQTGACFNLINPAGQPVWELERPGEQEQVDDGDPILRCDEPRRFDLWFVKEQQRVTFEVEQADDTWRVTERGRTAHHVPPADEAPPPDKLEQLTLKHLGTITLQADPAPPPEIRDITCFDLDDRGRIGFLRADQGRVADFLLINPDGTFVRKVNLKETLGERGSLTHAAWVGGDHWLLTAWTGSAAAEEESSELTIRAWWLDGATGALSAIEPFMADGVRAVAGTPDGGFVVTTRPPARSREDEQVVAFDREGKERWRVRPTSGAEITFGVTGVAATTDGHVVVERGYGDGLVFFTSDGRQTQIIDCEKLLGGPGASADFTAADTDGGLIVGTRYGEHQVYRFAADGTVRTRLRIKHRDGRPVDLAAFSGRVGVRVARDGTLWACDRHSLLRLNAEGLVEQVLGESPDNIELRDIDEATIDQAGNTYLADQRTGIIHVFDTAGRRVRLLRPDPGDVEDVECRRVSVAGDGSVWRDRVGFSADGKRLAKRTLPADVEEPGLFDGHICAVPTSGRYWVTSREAATLVGEDNRVLRVIKRRPNRDWLDAIEGVAVAPDGALALVAGESGAWGGADQTINLYSAAGKPLKTVAHPNVGDLDPLWGSIAFQGRFVLRPYQDESVLRYLLLDSTAEPPKWYSLGKLEPYEDRWDAFFVQGGRELWLLAWDARKIERFEVPVLPIAATSQPALPNNP